MFKFLQELSIWLLTHVFLATIGGSSQDLTGKFSIWDYGRFYKGNA